MTPDQMAALLGGEWPPPTEHWPPRDKALWREGMTLVGRIETRLTLPRPQGSPKRGEPYTAVVVRRASDGRRVTYHGWRTADEDLAGMDLSPGLLFGVVYRGKVGDFEDFKHYSTWYTESSGSAPLPGDDRQAGRPGPTPEQVKAAQREATETRNGHGAISRPDGKPPGAISRPDGPGPDRQDGADGSATPPAQARPEPGTAARRAALADPYDQAGVPTLEAIAAVRTRDDGQALVKDAGQAFKQAVKQQGARRPPHGAGVWGALWNSTDDALWRRVLTATREALAQPAEA